MAKRMWRPLAVSLVLAGSLPAGAWAAAVPFTWDPSAAGISSVAASTFTADNIPGLSDYSSITFNSPTNVTESSVLTVSSPLTLNNVASSPYLNLVSTPPSSTGLPGSFGLYFVATTTSSGTGTMTNFAGHFTSATVSLYGYNLSGGHLASVSLASGQPVITTPSSPVLLGTGSLLSSVSPNNANITNGIPNASLAVSFVPSASESGFFVSPTAAGYMNLDLQSVFTNTTGEITTSGNTILINGGGGSANFQAVTAVPEPTSLALLVSGVTILGFALWRRRAV